MIFYLYLLQGVIGGAGKSACFIQLGGFSMSSVKDVIKWSVIMCVAAILIYFVFPKYKFMGPNDFAVFRCNTVTGEVLVLDMDTETWVTPSRKTIGSYLRLIKD